MDVPYRLALLAVFAVSMSIAVYYRVQAAKSGERFDRRQEGLWLAVVLRVAGLVLWLSALVYLIWPPALAWASVWLPDAMRYGGILFGAAGAAMMYWTLTNLGKNLTDTVATRRDATLVTNGPYRYVRHPFYVTAALLMAAAALLSANLLIAVSGCAVIALLVLRTPKEEQKLVEKFGDPYRDYMARTGRFVPRVR
ncbi:MAG: isoprenylcysteine carboxylmethyltransferase family protein [Planctomycetota bacterium]|nr:MAG: isoprenylcysteine carboxylmethyltransferase family protein [Planctomycetota bacterium]